MSYDCVVDASVAVKLFLVEPLSDRADLLFNYLFEPSPAQFYVPDMFFAECANVLWKYVRRYGYAAADAYQNLFDLLQLPLKVTSTAELATRALEIAITNGITVYDAVYVALSERLSLPFVTADEILVRRLVSSNFDVRFLTDWP